MINLSQAPPQRLERYRPEPERPADDPVTAFIGAMVAAGLSPDEVAADGLFRRHATVDHPNSKNGWHVLYPDPPAGAFGNWASGLSETWSLGGEPLREADRRRLQEEIAKQKAERKAKQAEAAEKARQYLATLPPADDSNPYLSRKSVKPCPGLLADGDLLVVPIPGADGRPMSYQRITSDGSKRFAPGCPVAGGCLEIAGDGTGPLLICEGIATGLTLHWATGYTVLVALSANNLAAVATMARSRYPARQIVLAADNDIRTEACTGRNPGIEAAKAAAAAVGGFVVAADAGDFNDLHQGQGLEVVKRIIEAARPVEIVASVAGIAVATGEDWPDPLPLTPEEKAEPYPMEALPGLIGDAAAEVAGFVQCPAALAACSALAAVSTVAAGLVDVRRAKRLAGPAALFFIVLAESGERKTTADNAFTDEIRAWQARQAEAFKPDLQAWRAAEAAWIAERDGLITAIREASKRGKDTTELKERLADLETRKPERPMVPRLLWGDATTEALTWGLARRWPVAGILSSEGGAILGGHSMRPESVMKALATYNSLWDGLPLTIDRKTSDCYTVGSARLTLGVAVQPETMRQFIDGTRGLARGSGFLARFLVSWPESTQGRRMFQEAPDQWAALARFHRRLADLLNHPLAFDDLGALCPVVLDLDPEAKVAWIDFHDTVEAELAPDGEMAETRDVASKASDNAARMAALFHTFEHGPAGTIGSDHMRRAARIVAWHLFEARRFLNQIATPEAVADAMALETWLVDYCRRERLAVVPCNRAQKFGPNRTRRKAALDAALNELEGAGRIRRGTEGRKAVIILHPEIRERQ